MTDETMPSERAREMYAQALDDLGGAGARFIRAGHSNLWADPAMLAIDRALAEQPVPAGGWRLVPEEPTREMTTAGAMAIEQTDLSDEPGYGMDWRPCAHEAWRQMLSAAPAPSADREGA